MPVLNFSDVLNFSILYMFKVSSNSLLTCLTGEVTALAVSFAFDEVNLTTSDTYGFILNSFIAGLAAFNT